MIVSTVPSDPLPEARVCLSQKAAEIRTLPRRATMIDEKTSDNQTSLIKAPNQSAFSTKQEEQSPPFVGQCPLKTFALL